MGKPILTLPAAARLSLSAAARLHAQMLLNDTGTSLVTTTFGNAAAGRLYTDAAGNMFLVNYGAIADGDLMPNDVTLTVPSVVPEPSTWALLAVGLVALPAAARLRRTRLASLPA